MQVLNGFKLRSLGEDFILIAEGLEHINFNKMITMNESAAFLWKQVSDGSSFDAERLADLLCSEYEVTREKALHDAKNIILSWQNAGIIA